jgi:hypothetical protein
MTTTANGRPIKKPRKYRVKPEVEKQNPMYKVKRQKNNDAVRRSRDKAKQQQQMKDMRLQQLEEEVSQLRLRRRLGLGGVPIDVEIEVEPGVPLPINIEIEFNGFTQVISVPNTGTVDIGASTSHHGIEEAHGRAAEGEQ